MPGGYVKQFVLEMQETRIRVVGKESAGHKSRSLSIINPSPEGSQTTVFITDTNDELENWLDALHQHIYDQSVFIFFFCLRLQFSRFHDKNENYIKVHD